MSTNGNAALQLLDPPGAPEHRHSCLPQSPPDPVEDAIGEAVAAAAYAIVISVQGCLERGLIDPELKHDGAAKLARVAELALDYMGGDDDFIHKARAAGRRALRSYFDDSINPHLIDRAVNNALAPVFEIVGPIVETERIFRAAWSN